MVRAFLAIDLPRDIKKDLYNLSFLPIPEGVKLKWVEEENFHLTLKFFGNITENFVERISKVCQKVLKDCESFFLFLDEIGSFPEKGTPKVIWIGLRDTSGGLHKILNPLERAWRELKIEGDREKFHPHITILRVKRVENQSNLKDFVEKLRLSAEKLKGKGFLVREVVLFKSELRSTGPIYTPLARISLSEEK
ncbi:MAG: RNA 2',3'-cyclic phosphodiesterase [Caldimicrobium sp.]|nr:RNA 2',3'-cyclic phosphodiesterase [Caldimicrobium sp.]MCX7873328.1 RNA 2',3'-cyclic phosphodiesterase [Caldimicrobium sp.]MDW8093434.1 RNA 2',3'-cyclic phosphodiesterase [Caldimicrobium sp.]